MSEKRFTYEGLYPIHYSSKIRDNENDNILLIKEVVDLLNEQQATIEMYQRRVDKREEQISIIKKHCLKFLTNEQIETIKKELENG